MVEDAEFLGDMMLLGCKSCDLVFANPFPSDQALNFYYENIYRKPGRPHFVESVDEIKPGIWPKSQY